MFLQKTTHFVKMDDQEYKQYLDWKKHKLAGHHRTHYISYTKAQEFVKTYLKYNGNIDKTAKKLGITRGSAIVYRAGARAHGMEV